MRKMATLLLQPLSSLATQRAGRQRVGGRCVFGKVKPRKLQSKTVFIPIDSLQKSKTVLYMHNVKVAIFIS